MVQQFMWRGYFLFHMVLIPLKLMILIYVLFLVSLALGLLHSLLYFFFIYWFTIHFFVNKIFLSQPDLWRSVCKMNSYDPNGFSPDLIGGTYCLWVLFNQLPCVIFLSSFCYNFHGMQWLFSLLWNESW